MPGEDESGQHDYAAASAALAPTATPENRKRLAATFDSVAGRYHLARPEYPEELFDSLIELAGLAEGDRLLESGCGTGKATLALARRGFAITALEPGAALAAKARQNLAGFPQVEVVTATFENWPPLPGAAGFALVYAATSWHWVDPAERYRKAWRLLRPGGHLAFWSSAHVIPADGDPFFAELQDVYNEIGEGLAPGTRFARPGELPDARAEIEDSGLFGDVAVRQFDWEIRYDAEGYIALLNTFSGHIAMEPWQREHLQGEIRRRLAARADGMLRRHWGAVLHVARRRDAAKS